MPEKAKPDASSAAQTPEPVAWDSKYVRIGVFGLIAVAVAVAAAVLLSGGSKSSSGPAAVKPIGPIALSASGLKIEARDLDQVIYWVGPVAGDMYELTRTSANAVFVRYLPPGVKPGKHPGKYLIVATYPVTGALAALEAATDSGRLLTVKGDDGGIAAVELSKPTSVRVAFRGTNYQIEVYDPSPKEARKLATSGALKSVS